MLVQSLHVFVEIEDGVRQEKEVEGLRDEGVAVLDSGAARRCSGRERGREEKVVARVFECCNM